MSMIELQIEKIEKICGLSFKRMNATILYEYNIMCIARLKRWYIKGDKTKTCFFKVLCHIWS